MNKIFSISFIVLITFLTSCDKIKDPYPKTTSNPVDTTGGAVHIRRVLLEDFTGHKCPNCPNAQREADKLQNQSPTNYGERLIVVAIHANFFAKPDASGYYTADHRTTEGTALDAFFKPSNYPQGLVNRKDYPLLSHMKTYGNWATEIASIIDLPPDMDLTITNTYNSSNRNLDIEIKSEFLTEQTGDFKIAVYLTEDSVIAPQYDIAANPKDVLSYVHKHMFRGAINGAGGPWGDVLTSGTIAAGTKYTTNLTYTIPTSPNNIDPNHAHVIAFVYNDNSSASNYKQILQAAEAKVVE